MRHSFIERIKAHYFLNIQWKLLIACSVLVLSLNANILGQNILPNGGFEELRNDICETPDQSFARADNWYSLNATPDLFNGICDYNEEDFIFWSDEVSSFEGNNFVGLWSRWNSNNTYFTEGISTQLLAPLEAGKTYLFEMAVRNQGGYQGLDGSVSGCSLEPDKHIDLYLDRDSIQVINNFSNGTASTSSALVGQLNSEAVQGGLSDEWTIVSTCFEAQGGETFFALILPLGTFGDLPPCATMASSGVFRSFYYFIDDLSITESPQLIEREITTCLDQPFEVDIIELFDNSLLETAVFLWDDGISGSFRKLNETRNYSLTAELPCGILTLSLIVETESCPDKVFVPNAFSPNQDGQNDLFMVQVADNLGLFDFKLIVYDRWGNILYEGNNPNEGWDGRNKGNLVRKGIYVWYLMYKIESSESTFKEETGTVILIN